MVQLHGDEGPAFCAEVARRTGRQGDQGRAVSGKADIRALEAFHTDYHLLDAHRAGMRGGTGDTFDWELVRSRRSRIPLVLSGGLRPENVAEAIAAVRPVRRRHGQRHRGRARASRTPRRSAPSSRRSTRRAPSVEVDGMSSAVEHRFGPYGGQYVPETLMPALAELEQAWVAAREDAGFRAELDVLLRDFVGRPSPLYLAHRLSEVAGRRAVPQARGPQPHRRAQDQQRHRPGAAGPADGQARGSSPRPAPGQHGVATATACALMDLECVVYMGVEDIRRQAPNVQRMELLGATVSPVDAGARTLKEASSEAIRDWTTNVATTHYIIGSAVGPAPYPAIVRDLQRVIGDEARAQILEREGRLPDRVIACVGGGSNAIGIFAPFVGDEGVELIGVEAGGEALEPGRHGAPLTVAGRPGVLHGSLSAVLQDEMGQILEAHSISAGLDYPGSGPEHAHLRDIGRARYLAVSDAEALDDLPARHAAGGDHPGARDRARAALRAGARRLRARHRVLLGPRRQGPGRGPRAGTRDRAGAGAGRRHRADRRRRRSRRPSRRRRRAALMPYMMGGFPDMETSRRIGEAYADGGADLVELGVPFSDPLADGPVIHAAGTAALRAGATTHEVLAVGRALAERVPVVAMVYANLVHGARPRALRRRPRGARALRADRARPAAGGERRRARGVRRGRPRAGAAGGADDARRAHGAHRRQRPRLRLRGLGGGHDRRARRAGRRLRGHRDARQGVDRRSRSRSGSASGRPSRRAQAADAGADGVIVGSRLVRAVAEARGSRRPPSTSWWRSSRRP